jgi:phosphoribosylaminoimidazolecarboxamide formyltransferase/IMP cyclohydrolase
MRLVEEIDDLVPVRTVLASVTDKSGLETMIPELVRACPDVKIISTGGTYGRIKEHLGDAAEGTLMTIEDYTGDPEIAGGLVKSLGYPKSLGLLTNTYWPEHQQSLADKGIPPIDVVVCNLYPFQDVVAKEGCTPEMARSNMDIGGPTMTNEAAKNLLRVAMLGSPEQYAGFLEQLRQHEGATSLDFRLRCAKHAFWSMAEEAKARAAYWVKIQTDDLKACYKVNERGR